MLIRSVVRWTLRILAGTVGLILIAAVGVYGYSNVRMSHRYAVPEHPIHFRVDSATLATGKRLVTVRGCVDCHGATLGGNVMFDDPAIGRMAAPNLTLGGRGAQL